jgi:23S rRNA-/tRNA-specific pseudouridylate synthase
MPQRLNILHQDDHHAVVLKEAGMSSHGRGRQNLSALLALSKGLPEGAKPVHRLDYGTRGPVLVAWSSEVMTAFQAQWPSMVKTYHSWCRGQDLPCAGRCGFPIDGKPSSSTFKVLGTRRWAVHGSATLVEWTIDTGRTHQIRRHAAALGHPVVGDLVYGTPPLYTGAGLHLTCTRLDYRHPVTGKAMAIQIRPAKKMRRAIQGDFTAAVASKFTELFEG